MRPLHFTDEDFDDLIYESMINNDTIEITARFFMRSYNLFKDINYDFVDQLKIRIESMEPNRFYEQEQTKIISLGFMSKIHKKYFTDNPNKKYLSLERINVIRDAFYVFKKHSKNGHIPPRPDVTDITLEQQIYILDKSGFFNNDKTKKQQTKIVSLLLQRSYKNTYDAIRNRFSYDNVESVEKVNEILKQLGIEKL